MIIKVKDHDQMIGFLNAFCVLNGINNMPSWHYKHDGNLTLIDLDDSFIEKLKSINPNIVEELSGY